MSIGRVHRISAAVTLGLPILGLLDASLELRSASIALAVAVVFALLGFRSPRSPARRGAVHGITVLALLPIALLFQRSRIDAGLSVVLLGIFNRVWLRAGQRDDLILVGASGVLLAAASVITPGAVYGVILVAFIPAAFWYLLTANLLGVAERVEPGRRPRLEAELAARPAPKVGRSLTGLGLAFMVAGYIAVSFLPRVRFGHFLSPGGLLAFGGAGPRMELNADGVRGIGGGTNVLRIWPEKGQPALPEGLYARLYTLDGWDERGFYDTEGEPQPAPWIKSADPRDCPHVQLERLVERGEPHPVVSIGTGAPGAVRVDPPLARSSGTWLTRMHSAELRLEQRACLGEDAPMPAPDPEARRHLTRLRDGVDPRVPRLAETLSAGTSTDLERIQRILGHFDRGFVYSLEPLPGQASDPLARFLFEAKQGHCELYAGAAVALMRASGIPARVVAGYYGGWLNHRSGSLEMGTDDAHAWVEAFDGTRWRWFDPTPPELRSRRDGKPLAALRDLWDAIESLWYTYIIDFDDRRRREVIGKLGDMAKTAVDPGAWLASADPVQRRAGGASIALFGVALLALAGAGYGLARRRRRSGPRLARRLRAALEKGGPSDPRPVRSLARAHPRPQLALRAVDAVEALRFGPAAEGGVEAALAALRALERSAVRVQSAPSSSG